MGTTAKLGIGDIVTISDENGNNGKTGRIVKIVTTVTETAKEDMTGRTTETVVRVHVLVFPDMTVKQFDSSLLTKN